MKTKLTLSIDRNLVRQAHMQASKEKRSVSSLFADFLVARQAQTTDTTVGVKDMVGTLKTYKIDDTKSTIRRITTKKHSA